MFVLKMQKIPLVLWRVPAWTEYLEECRSGAAWETLGISEDCPADKISACSDQGPEIKRVCWLDHRDCYAAAIYGLFLDAILLYALFGPLSDP